MIKIPDTSIIIKTPEELSNLAVDLKNYLFVNLEKGDVLFKIPSFENQKSIDEKKACKIYKIGFLYDALSAIYPLKKQLEKYKIIHDQYHVFLTYRQYIKFLNEYESDQTEYIKN